MNGNDRDRDRNILRDVGVIEGDRDRAQNRDRRRGLELSSDNLDGFDWKNRRQIVVRKCVPEIHKHSLQQCKKHLTSLSFRLMVTRVNLMAFLSIGQNLTQIVFENVLLDEYKPLYFDGKTLHQTHSHEKESHSSQSQKRNAKKRLKASSSSSSSSSSVTTFKSSSAASTSGTIELPHLKELYFSAAVSLTKNDYNLLDFFLRCVSTRKLEYFEFIGNARLFRDMTESESNPVTELYGQKDQYQNIVARFLIKNKSSLKFIVIGGTGFKMFNKIEDQPHLENQSKKGQNPLPLLSPEELEELQKLDLTGLDVAMDDNGIEEILSTQKNLQSLVVTAISFNIPQNTPLLLHNILQCCRNNYETLVEFYFKPKLISQKSRSTLLHENIQCRHHPNFNSNNNSNNNNNNNNNDNNNNNNNNNNSSSNNFTNCSCCTLLDTFIIDCSIFSQCPALKYLTLSLNILTSEHGIRHGWPDENTVISTIQGVSLKNIQLLPKGLKTLHLDAEQFNFLELELLANQFFKFTQLREFSFRASPNFNRWNTDNNGFGMGDGDGGARNNISFLVKIQWIWVLFQHSRMTKVNFEGGMIDDLDGVHEFINGQRDISFVMNGTKICFEKIID